MGVASRRFALVERQAGRGCAELVGGLCDRRCAAGGPPGRLRDELGDRMIAGIVLHTGPRSFALDDRLTVLPISTVWA